MRLDIAKIEKLLGQVYDRLQSIDDKAANTEARRQFVFHMTDWLDDLERLAKLYEEGELRKDKAAQTVAGFLYHVIPHLNAAGRLLLDNIPDPFNPRNARKADNR
jgi:hypothetical protein